MKQQSLEHALSEELATLEAPHAERLGSLLRGLLSCLQDLNQRVAHLETSVDSLPTKPRSIEPTLRDRVMPRQGGLS